MKFRTEIPEFHLDIIKSIKLPPSVISILSQLRDYHTRFLLQVVGWRRSHEDSRQRRHPTINALKRLTTRIECDLAEVQIQGTYFIREAVLLVNKPATQLL